MKERTKVKMKFYVCLGIQALEGFFPLDGPYLIDPSKGYEDISGTKGQNLIKGLPNACSMPYCKECTTFKYYPNWFQPFDDEISFRRNPISFASLLPICGKGSSN